ncbi:MAG TPA: M15 family metallopeptidase [Crinalium sp.]
MSTVQEPSSSQDKSAESTSHSTPGDKKTNPVAVRLLVSPSRTPVVRLKGLKWFKRRLKWLVIWLVSLISFSVALAYDVAVHVTVQPPANELHVAYDDVSPLAKTIKSAVQYRSQLNEEELSEQEGRSPSSQDDPTLPLTRFGHLLYAEADADRLMVVGSYSQDLEQRFERLLPDAGLALMRMIDAARMHGVWIVPVSGFRDAGRQEMLFKLQIQRQGSASAAAKSVAPPGFSEHHTGYAVDLADGLARARDVTLRFGETDAFKWLMQNAHDFGFELSFPENNSQGVEYEPWHWRYVGSPDAARTFAEAHQFFEQTAGIVGH